MSSNIKRTEAIVASDLTSSAAEETVCRVDAFLMVVDMGTGIVTHVSNTVNTALGLMREEVERCHIRELLLNGRNQACELLKDIERYEETGERYVQKKYSVQMCVGLPEQYLPEMEEFENAIQEVKGQMYAPVNFYGQIQYYSEAGKQGKPCLVVVGHRATEEGCVKTEGNCKNIFLGKVSATGRVISGIKYLMLTALEYHPTVLMQEEKSLFDFVHPDDVEIVKMQLKKTFDKPGFHRTIFRMIHQKGHYVFVDADTHAVMDVEHDATLVHLFLNVVFDKLHSFSFKLTPELHVEGMKGYLQHLTGRSLKSIYTSDEDVHFTRSLVHMNEQSYVNESLEPVLQGRQENMLLLFRFIKENLSTVYVRMRALGIKNTEEEVIGLECTCILMKDSEFAHLDPRKLNLDFDKEEMWDESDEEEEEEEEDNLCEDCLMSEAREREAYLKERIEAELRSRSDEASRASGFPHTATAGGMPWVTPQTAVKVHGAPVERPTSSHRSQQNDSTASGRKARNGSSSREDRLDDTFSRMNM